MNPPTSSLILKKLVQIALGIAVFVALWQLIVVGFKIPKYLVPLPWEVAKSARQNWNTLAGQAGLTLLAAGLGLAMSTVFAIGVALSFSMSRSFAQASLPLVMVFRSMPVAAVAPIMMLIFGRGIGTGLAVVTIVSFFPLLVNMMRGLQSADGNAAELLHVYGASRWQNLRLVRIPYALPYLFTGLRVAGSSAILGAMLSEWITGTKGLGNLILESGEMRETELLWAAVLMSVAVALIVFWGTSAGEKRMLRWTQR
jgi:ABC-type nitrate/sulfonate/bicarbonate transport system permease component